MRIVNLKEESIGLEIIVMSSLGETVFISGGLYGTY